MAKLSCMLLKPRTRVRTQSLQLYFVSVCVEMKNENSCVSRFRRSLKIPRWTKLTLGPALHSAS